MVNTIIYTTTIKVQELIGIWQQIKYGTSQHQQQKSRIGSTTIPIGNKHVAHGHVHKGLNTFY